MTPGAAISGFDLSGSGISPAGIQIETVIIGIIGSGSDHRRRIAGRGDGSIRIRRQKGNVGIRKSCDRQPDMITAAVVISGIYPYFPGSGGRICKSHKDQLASGNCLDDLRADKNPGIFQDKGDIFRVAQSGRDLLDHFAQRGTQSLRHRLPGAVPTVRRRIPGCLLLQGSLQHCIL